MGTTDVQWARAALVEWLEADARYEDAEDAEAVVAASSYAWGRIGEAEDASYWYECAETRRTLAAHSLYEHRASAPERAPSEWRGAGLAVLAYWRAVSHEDMRALSERAARACLVLAQHGAELLRGRSARLRPLAEEARETIARWVEIDRDYHPDWPEAPRQQIAWIRVRRAEQASRAFASQRLRDALGAWRDSDERVSPEEEWRRVALALEDYARVLEPLMEDSAYTDEELLAATREAADAAWVVADYAEARRHAEAEAA